MATTATRERPSPLIALAIGLAFALAYTQSPLYTGNQNTYMLYGLAAEGYGQLAADWMAGTTDPTPAFTWLVRLTYRYLDVRLFHIYMVALIALYGWCLLGIVHEYAPARARWPLVAALLVLHTKALDVASLRLLGFSLRSLFANGVADQYILGSTLQPAIFGVFLLASVYAFVRRRPYLAVLSLLVATTLHPSYMLTAGLLTVAYTFVLLRERHWRTAALVGGLALVGVLPTALHTLSVFGATSPEIARRAAAIVVHERLPHHALPSAWFDWTVLFKATLVALALWVTRKQRLFWVLAVASAGCLLASLAQAVTGSDQLALLFPWRTSVLLVPLATGLATASALRWVSTRFGMTIATRQRLLNVLAVCAILLSMVSGVFGQVALNQRQARTLADPMLTYVRDTLAPGDTYLVPVEFETFRLDTGASIYADWKTRPFKDTDVLAWYARVQRARDVYAHLETLTAADWQAVRTALGVTHIIIPAAQTPAASSGLIALFAGDDYRVYRLP
jgi:hypothetical protein